MNKFASLMSNFNHICKLPTRSKASIIRFLQNNHIAACFDCAYLHNLGKVLLQVRLHGVNSIPQALVSLCTGMHFSSLYGLAVSHCSMNAETAGY